LLEVPLGGEWLLLETLDSRFDAGTPGRSVDPIAVLQEAR
jgi:hypothetical protein